MMQTISAADENELTFTRFDRMSALYPERPAVVYLGESLSFRRLRELSERFAGSLSDMGIAKGDRVMLYIANSIQWVVAFLGIQRVGAVAVPVSPIYTSHEITYMIRDCGVQAVLCMDTNFGYVQEAAAQTGLQHVIVTNLADLLPAWKKVLGTLFDKILSGKVEWGPNVHRFRRLLRQQRSLPHQTSFSSSTRSVTLAIWAHYFVLQPPWGFRPYSCLLKRPMLLHPKSSARGWERIFDCRSFRYPGRKSSKWENQQICKFTVADMSGQACWELDLRQPLALMVGGEAEGASEAARKLATVKISIPMTGSIESLNAGVAGSVLIFEVVRQRTTALP